MKILGLIPARGGSKGIPGKNLRPLAGRPLIEWTFESAIRAEVLDRLVLSTDDDLIAQAGKASGIEVPFRRPHDLATDEAPMISVLLHALEQLALDGYEPDAVALLQPTSPLRQPEHIRIACGTLHEADSVCSVVALPKRLCPHYVMRIDDNGYLKHFLPEGSNYARRQDVPLAYSRDGTIYLATTEVITKRKTLYGDHCLPMPIDPIYSLSIDDQEDWEEAERRLLARKAEPHDEPDQ